MDEQEPIRQALDKRPMEDLPSQEGQAKLIIGVAILFGAFLGGLATYVLIEPWDSDDQLGNANEVLLYEKRELWGPCPNPDGGCFLNTYLYSSGRLVLESLETEELRLSSESVDKITSQIIDSGVMKARCREAELVDYWVTYDLNIDRRKKTIRFPGCQDELGVIDDVIGGEMENARESEVTPEADPL